MDNYIVTIMYVFVITILLKGVVKQQFHVSFCGFTVDLKQICTAYKKVVPF